MLLPDFINTLMKSLRSYFSTEDKNKKETIKFFFKDTKDDNKIIDEPEISLNIKWQRELMGLFSKLLPNTQIIVASHAPALAKRHPDFLAKLNVWRE